MRVVVDTNVIAYFLLGTEPFRRECARFWGVVKEPLAPASWEAELTNVLWMAIRKDVIGLPEALTKLRLAESLGITSEPVTRLWEGALARAVSSGLAAYDTVFVELAVRVDARLATFDEKVLKAFPRVAKRPRALLRAQRRTP